MRFSMPVKSCVETKEVVLAAAVQNTGALQYASEVLLNDDQTMISTWLVITIKGMSLRLLQCSLLKELPALVRNLMIPQQAMDQHRVAEPGLGALLASIFGMTSLRTLNRSNCEVLKDLRVSMKDLAQLRTLSLVRCPGLEALPSSIGDLTQLQLLNLAGCSGRKKQHERTGESTQLQVLNLNVCSGLKELPTSMQKMVGLRSLGLQLCEVHPWHLPSQLEMVPSFVGQL